MYFPRNYFMERPVNVANGYQSKIHLVSVFKSPHRNVMKDILVDTCIGIAYSELLPIVIVCCKALEYILYNLSDNYLHDTCL